MNLLNLIPDDERFSINFGKWRRTCQRYGKILLTSIIAMCISFVGTHFTSASESKTFTELVPPNFKGFSATVVGDVCYIRKGPSTDTSSLGTVTEGTKLTVEDYRNNWAKVKSDKLDGWIAGWLIDVNLKEQNVQAVITRTDVNVRQGPGLSNKVLSMTQQGTVFPAEAKRGEWICVRLSTGGVAWIFETLLKLEWQSDGKGGKSSSGNVESDKEQNRSTVEVVRTDVNFRSGPSTNYSVIGSLNRGDVLDVLGKDGGWINAISPLGIKGWVASYLTDDAQGSIGNPADGFQTSSELAGKLIVVDPGHGGLDPGVISSNGTREKDITLAVSLKTRTYLERLGAKVIMTRSGDYTPGSDWGSHLGDLDSRIYLANSNNADAFVSIHVNSFPSDRQVSGLLGIHCPGSSQSKRLTSCITSNVSRTTGVHHRGNRSENFRVVLRTTMPATLIELGFMTNPGDASLLIQDTYQDLAAQGIAKGVAEFFSR